MKFFIRLFNYNASFTTEDDHHHDDDDEEEPPAGQEEKEPTNHRFNIEQIIPIVDSILEQDDKVYI